MKDRPVVRYDAVAQTLHWVTAVLVLAAFIYGPGGSEERVYSAARDLDRRLHESLGLCVLALVTMRLYFAYGSNMSSRRLTAPKRAPSATWVAVGYGRDDD